MDNKIDRQIDGKLDRQIKSQAYRQQDRLYKIRQINSWIDRQLYRQILGQIYSWKNKQLERQIVEQIDSWMDRQVGIQIDNHIESLVYKDIYNGWQPLNWSRLRAEHIYAKQ